MTEMWKHILWGEHVSNQISGSRYIEIFFYISTTTHSILNGFFSFERYYFSPHFWTFIVNFGQHLDEWWGLEWVCDVQCLPLNPPQRTILIDTLTSQSDDYYINVWLSWNDDTPCERMKSYYQETQFYGDESTSLLEYQAICPGHNMVF